MSGNLINPRGPTGSARSKQGAIKGTTPNTLLQAARHRQGWTQQALADQLGTTPLTINRWEQGKAAPGAYFRTRLCDLFGLNKQELGLTPQEPQESLSPNTSLWLVPYRRNAFFTGRNEILQHLHHLLTQDQPGVVAHSYAICGLGGIGKTQTALEYCYRFGEDYQAVFWIRAETRELLLADMLAIADLLDLTPRHEPEQLKVIKAVKRWLKEHPSWLLVLDNVEDFPLLEEVLPADCAGHVLLTTRSQFTGTVAQRIDLPRLQREEGIRFLLRRSKLLSLEGSLETVAEGLWNTARTIVELLGGLPLALDQVAAYLEETGCGLEDYLDRYEQQRAVLLNRRGMLGTDHPHSVMATVHLACRRVQQVNPAALELLQLCAFLHADAIPEEMITAGHSHLGPVLQTVAADAYQLDETIATLRAYSLVHRDVHHKFLTMHHLVQAILRDRVSANEQQIWQERVIRALNQIFPASALQESVEYWQRCEYLLPHALECAALDMHGNSVVAEAASLLTKTATYLRQRARYQEAESLYQRALQLREQALGPEHPEVAWPLHGLAKLYSKQSRYSEAEPLYQRALQIWEQALGADHPTTAHALNGLAELYNEQGKYSEAEPLLQRVVHIWEQALGSGHPDLTAPLNNLGFIYNEQGRYAEAEQLLRRAIHVGEQALDPEHPELAVSLINLGFLYGTLGRYAESELLLRRAIHIGEQALGPEHPDLAATLNNLGFIYNEQGRYSEAEPFLRRALDIGEQALGSEHPRVGSALKNLGLLACAQGRYTEAEHLYQRALQIWEQALGSDHPHIAHALSGLAELYGKQSKHAEAEHLYQRVLQMREQALGPEHPMIISPLIGLGVIYNEQGRYSEAEPLLQRALDIGEQALGSEHPRVGSALKNLGLLACAQGRYTEAEHLYQRALQIWEQALGSDHPHIAHALSGLAELYGKQGRYNEARSLLQRVVQIREQALGPHHPETVESFQTLAVFSQMHQKLTQTEPLDQQAIVILERIEHDK